jgi:hypothetical protein
MTKTGNAFCPNGVAHRNGLILVILVILVISNFAQCSNFMPEPSNMNMMPKPYQRV